ncbi:hypothetical protein [Lysinibacillus sp. TE18511]
MQCNATKVQAPEKQGLLFSTRKRSATQRQRLLSARKLTAMFIFFNMFGSSLKVGDDIW